MTTIWQRAGNSWSGRFSLSTGISAIWSGNRRLSFESRAGRLVPAAGVKKRGAMIRFFEPSSDNESPNLESSNLERKPT
jgi:hypothetical protein